MIFLKIYNYNMLFIFFKILLFIILFLLIILVIVLIYPISYQILLYTDNNKIKLKISPIFILLLY